MKSRWTIPIPDVTLPTFLFGSPDHPLPNVPQYLDADQPSLVVTCHGFRELSKRLAAGLKKEGLRQGEPVLLYSGNSIFFPVVFMATIMAGGIFTAANPGYNAREVAYQLKNSGAKIMICAEQSMETALDAASEAGVPKERTFMFSDDAFSGKAQGKAGCRHWSSLIASEAEGRNFRWEDGGKWLNETCVLNYSSGTTGLPKGVEISHRNIVSNCLQQSYLNKLRPTYKDGRHDWRWLGFTPMYHAMAQTIYCVMGPHLRTPVYVMKKFDFAKMLEYTEKYRITELQLVPPIVTMLVKSPLTKKFDLSSVEFAGSGAAPLGREVSTEFNKLWPTGRMNLKQGYGMSEMTCSSLGWDPTQISESFSVGEPNANCEVKLVNESGREVPQGERGEIWVRAPNIMKGYWKNENATKESITPDGFLRTGDIAYVDEHGHFFVVDRLKELIKVKGMQVAPAELEGQLLEHEAISDAAVIGVTVNGDEVPRAYCVLAQGCNVSAEDVVRFMESKVSRHKRLLGGVKFVDAIQKNPSGKILRRMYREQAQKELGDSAPKDSKL